MCEEYEDEAMRAFWAYLAEPTSLDEETTAPIVLRSLPTVESTRAKPRPLAR